MRNCKCCVYVKFELRGNAKMNQDSKQFIWSVRVLNVFYVRSQVWGLHFTIHYEDFWNISCDINKKIRTRRVANMNELCWLLWLFIKYWNFDRRMFIKYVYITLLRTVVILQNYIIVYSSFCVHCSDLWALSKLQHLLQRCPQRSEASGDVGGHHFQIKTTFFNSWHA